MKVYSYNPATGEYLGETTADESPLEPGKFLMPAHTTETPPCLLTEHTVAVWDGSEWSKVEDHRGEKGYIGSSQEETEIKEIGPLPDEWSDTPPPPTFEEELEQKLQELSGKYRSYLLSGSIMTSIGFNMQVGNEHSASLENAIIMAEIKEQESIYITDADDVSHPNVPIEDARKILFEQREAVLAAHSKKQELRDRIKGATTVEELIAIEISF